MLCSFALFVSSFGFIDPEKPHWGSGQLRNLFIYLFIYLFLTKLPFHLVFQVLLLSNHEIRPAQELNE